MAKIKPTKTRARTILKACKALKAKKPTCQPEEIFNGEPGDTDGLDQRENWILYRSVACKVD